LAERNAQEPEFGRGTVWQIRQFPVRPAGGLGIAPFALAHLAFVAATMLSDCFLHAKTCLGQSKVIAHFGTTPQQLFFHQRG
jgi:hypothetical protein